MRVAPSWAVLLISGLIAAPAWAGPRQAKPKSPASRGTRPPTARPAPATAGALPGFNPGISTYTRPRAAGSAAKAAKPNDTTPTPIDPNALIATETNFKKPRKPPSPITGGPVKAPKRPSLTGPDDTLKSFKPKDRSKTQNQANSTILPPR